MTHKTDNLSQIFPRYHLFIPGYVQVPHLCVMTTLTVVLVQLKNLTIVIRIRTCLSCMHICKHTLMQEYLYTAMVHTQTHTHIQTRTYTQVHTRTHLAINVHLKIKVQRF